MCSTPHSRATSTVRSVEPSSITSSSTASKPSSAARQVGDRRRQRLLLVQAGDLDDQLHGAVRVFGRGRRMHLPSALACRARLRTRLTDSVNRVYHERLTLQPPIASMLGAPSRSPRAGAGRVSPNPLVGAVVVARRGGYRRGLPRRARRPARRAGGAGGLPRARRGPGRGDDVRDARACAHQGRQPPCVEAMLEAGIARVVIASEDPSEKAAGRGPGILRDGGVEVAFAAGAEAAAARLPQPALPQARPHRPAAGRPEAGDVARRPDRDRRPATRPGSPASESRELVHRWRGRIRRDRRRHRHRARRRPAAHRPPRRRPPAAARRLRLRRPPAARLPAPRRPSTSARCWSSPPPTPTRPGRRPARRRRRARSSPAAPTRPSESAAALAELGRRGITSLFLEGGRDPRRRLRGRRPDRRVAHLRRPAASRLERPPALGAGWPATPAEDSLGADPRATALRRRSSRSERTL